MKPMLACDIDFDKAQYPLWGFPKLDGVRASNYNGKLLARSMEPHENLFTTNKYSGPLFSGLDGELVVGSPIAEDVLNKTSSATRTINWEGNISWYVFDFIGNCINTNPSYEERYNALLYVVEDSNLAKHNVYVLNYKIVNSKEEAIDFYKSCLTEGYEGAIFRNPKAKRKNGRSSVKYNDFLRAKPQSDKEARIVSVYEAMENRNEAKTNALGRTERSSHKENLVGKNTLGGMVGIDLETGQQINIAPGKLLHSEREHLWHNQQEIVGKIVKYRSMDKGVKDKPRFARFISFRSERDMSK